MKHFIFDLGGVIIKPMNRKYIYDKLKCSLSYEEFKYLFSNGEEASKLHKREITLEEYFDFLKKYINVEISLDEFIEIYRNSKLGFYQDTVNIIKKLKSLGIKVYLLSNLREIDFEFFQEEFDISVFDSMFLSYEIDMLKPSDSIYQYVINAINDKPENMYFFDDSENNVNAALKNKINAYKVTGENIKEVFKKINIYFLNN